MKYILIELIGDDKQYYSSDNRSDITWQICHICKMRGIEDVPEAVKLVELDIIKHSKGVTSVSEFILSSNNDILQLFKIVEIT